MHAHVHTDRHTNTHCTQTHVHMHVAHVHTCNKGTCRGTYTRAHTVEHTNTRTHTLWGWNIHALLVEIQVFPYALHRVVASAELETGFEHHF